MPIQHHHQVFDRLGNVVEEVVEDLPDPPPTERQTAIAALAAFSPGTTTTLADLRAENVKLKALLARLLLHLRTRDEEAR